MILSVELRHEKTNILHRRTQRRRSASQYIDINICPGGLANCGYLLEVVHIEKKRINEMCAWSSFFFHIYEAISVRFMGRLSENGLFL